jgi:hypothetical protein
MEICCGDDVLDVNERFVFSQRLHLRDACLSVQLNPWTIFFVEGEYWRTVCLKATFFANFLFSFLIRCWHGKATSHHQTESGKNMPPRESEPFSKAGSIQITLSVSIDGSGN